MLNAPQVYDFEAALLDEEHVKFASLGITTISKSFNKYPAHLFCVVPYIIVVPCMHALQLEVQDFKEDVQVLDNVLRNIKHA